MLSRLSLAILSCAALAGAACQRTPSTPPGPDAAKGDALLRQMSQTLATTQAFSYTAAEVRQRVRSNGEKVEDRFSRRVVVRRPNALMFSDSGAAHDAVLWYDGKRITLLSTKDKVWARGPMPATLDEAMDFVSAEYAIQLPTADLLYSSPYDAFMTKDTTGGWVGTEAIGDVAYDHLSYQQPVVDWQVWLTPDERRLPKQVLITYKTEKGQPWTRVTFSDWNAAAQVTDATFAAVVPAGYRRIKIMRHATVSDGTLDQASDSPSDGQPGQAAPTK